MNDTVDFGEIANHKFTNTEMTYVQYAVQMANARLVEDILMHHFGNFMDARDSVRHRCNNSIVRQHQYALSCLT